MAAFVVIEIEVTDPALYEEYKKLATPAIEKYGGRYLVRGGRSEALEGGWSPKRLVILQFDSVQRAKEWWSSAGYSRAREIRNRAAKSKAVLAEGL
jgi:uncharacterized protein (DUF1330 family)